MTIIKRARPQGEKVQDPAPTRKTNSLDLLLETVALQRDAGAMIDKHYSMLRANVEKAKKQREQSRKVAAEKGAHAVPNISSDDGEKGGEERNDTANGEMPSAGKLEHDQRIMAENMNTTAHPIDELTSLLTHPLVTSTNPRATASASTMPASAALLAETGTAPNGNPTDNQQQLSTVRPTMLAPQADQSGVRPVTGLTKSSQVSGANMLKLCLLDHQAQVDATIKCQQEHASAQNIYTRQGAQITELRDELAQMKRSHESQASELTLLRSDWAQEKQDHAVQLANLCTELAETKRNQAAQLSLLRSELAKVKKNMDSAARRVEGAKAPVEFKPFLYNPQA